MSFQAVEVPNILNSPENKRQKYMNNQQLVQIAKFHHGKTALTTTEFNLLVLRELHIKFQDQFDKCCKIIYDGQIRY